MVRLEDSGVDTAAEVFDEGNEEAGVDLADAEGRVDEVGEARTLEHTNRPAAITPSRYPT